MTTIELTVVVNGKDVLTTTDRDEAERRIDKALREKKADVRLTWPR